MDLDSLTQTDLLRIVNGTPLGTVLTRSRLRRHLDAAAHRVAGTKGRTIHFLKYLRWLILEAERPRTAGADYAEKRRRQAVAGRAATKAAQDVAPVPDVADWSRREKSLASLRTFCETYYPAAFRHPWSDDHLRAIEVLQNVITGGGLFAFAMYRSAGKTTLARAAAMWALLGDHVDFVSCIAASERHAQRLLMAPTKMSILEAADLAADFPEALYPLRCLENSSKRQLAQHVGGRLTHVRWDPDMIVFPTVWPEHLPPSFAERGIERGAARGAIFGATGLDAANIRGQQHTRPDGTVARPGLVILDDPQTRESARSSNQTDYRLGLINGDVLGMAGPDRNISAVVLCTKIYAEDLTDRLLDPEKSPAWQGQCTKLVVTFPKNLKLWDEYAERRRQSIQAGRQGRDATTFYRKHRAAMDAGAKVAWDHLYDRRSELSTLQHAMNLKLRDEQAFYAEYQNEPMQEQLADEVVTPDQVAAKVNGRRRGQVPLAATTLTGFVDVHDRLLFWAVCAWEETFTGYVVDYGAFPDQERRWFAMHNARHTLTKAFRGHGEDGAILAGLEALVPTLLTRTFPVAGGHGVRRIGRLLVDMGYKPELVAAAKHKVGGAAMELSRGVGIGARNKPMSAYQRKPGERHGHHWYTPTIRGTREFPHVAVDTNYWKSFVHRAIATPAGDAGSLSLFGKRPKDHELIAEHVAGSEHWVETVGYGRTVHEWKQRPNRPDNHWLDCLVGCAAAAAMGGCRTPGMEASGVRRRKRYTQADLSGRRKPA